MNYLLDTNVLVRFLVQDNQAQYEQAVSWFKQAEAGKMILYVEPLVIAETTFVLESFYKIDKKKVAAALLVFLSQEWLKVPERDVLLGLWKHYEKGLHFVDSYLLAMAESGKKTKILSFDQQLLKQHAK